MHFYALTVCGAFLLGLKREMQLINAFYQSADRRLFKYFCGKSKYTVLGFHGHKALSVTKRRSVPF
jgi:hypothetical protein